VANRLDYKTAAGRTVADIVMAPLLTRGTDFRVVDAGARNGMQELPACYAAHADYVGFEPNEAEYQKLVTGTTDASKAGFAPPRWKSETYYPCALWSRSEQRPFTITVGTGACSLMGAASAPVTQRMYLQYPGGRGERQFYDHHLRTQRTTEVECRRLDELIDGTRPIDYFKLDVEGAELAVLEGAERLFAQNRVLFVKTEFVMVPYYETHPLFGHQQAFLERWRMRFLGFDLAHARYTRDHAVLPPAVDRRLIHAGDAFFALDPDRTSLSSEDLHRIGIMSIIHGFASFGLSLMRDAGLLSTELLAAVESALAHVPLRSRARYFFEQFPYDAARRLTSLGALLRRVSG
jgi:FkbM family methyltransferase